MNVNSSEVFIVTKINNKIITNLDIEKEYRYLVSLNEKLNDLDKNSLMSLAKNSIIKEKIKLNELNKYIEIDIEDPFVVNYIEKFIKTKKFNNQDDFKNYLKKFDLDINEVKTKIAIELFWNELITTKFKSQLVIDIDKLEKEIQEYVKKTKKYNNNYKLIEIVFQPKNENDLISLKAIIKKSILDVGFENTASLYSIADTSKLGGLIGWVKEEQLSKKINDKIKDLEIGGVSKIIKINNTFLYLKIVDKNKVEANLNKEKILNDKIKQKKNEKLTRLSLIYYNKIKLNAVINEN